MRGLKSKTLVCLLSVLVSFLGLLVPLVFAASLAATNGYTWTDTQGPGNGMVSSLLFFPSRNELCAGTQGQGVAL